MRNLYLPLIVSLLFVDSAAALSFDELMSDEHEATPQSSPEISVYGESLDSGVEDGSLGFDTVHEGREQIAVNKLKTMFQQNNEMIADKCACVSSRSCFIERSYGHEQVASAMRAAARNAEARKTALCSKWMREARSVGMVTRERLEVIANSSKTVLQDLVTMDDNYSQTLTALDDREQGEKSNSAKSFMKLLVLGSVTGLAGQADVSAEQAAQVIGSTATDLYRDDGRMSSSIALNQSAQQQLLDSYPNASVSNGDSRSEQTTKTQKVADYTIRCEATGQKVPVKLPYYTEQCLPVLRRFSTVMACNLVDDMESIKSECASACGSPDCMERP